MHTSNRYLADDSQGGLTGNLKNRDPKKLVSSNTAVNATTGLYDLWLNSKLPAVGPAMVTGVTASSSHQIDTERLAEKLMQLCASEKPQRIIEERI